MLLEKETITAEEIDILLKNRTLEPAKEKKPSSKKKEEVKEEPKVEEKSE